MTHVDVTFRLSVSDYERDYVGHGHVKEGVETAARRIAGNLLMLDPNLGERILSIKEVRDGA